MKDAGVDFKNAGISHFGSETTAESLAALLKESPDEIENILQDLCNIGTNTNDWNKQIEEHTGKTAILMKQTRTAQQNLNGLAQEVKNLQASTTANDKTERKGEVQATMSALLT